MGKWVDQVQQAEGDYFGNKIVVVLKFKKNVFVKDGSNEALIGGFLISINTFDRGKYLFTLLSNGTLDLMT